MKTFLLGITILFLQGCNLESINNPDIQAISNISSNDKVLLEVINKYRTNTQDCGINGIYPPAKPLRWNEKLYNTALEHSQDMASVEHLSHNGSGTNSDLTAVFYDLDRGSYFYERMKYNSYTQSHKGPFAENVLYGTFDISPKKAMDIWIASDNHCKNIMNRNLTEVAIASAKSKKGWTYWSMELGN